MNRKLFRNDPRGYALDMVDEGLITAESLLTAALKYMSADEVREMLDMNELSPRFAEYEDAEEVTD